MAGYTGKYEGVKIFSATMVEYREKLGERITEWITKNKADIEVLDTVVTQSSDEQFHCLALTIFYNGVPSWASPTPIHSNRR